MVTKCPACQKSLKVPDTAVGRKGKCPACGTTFLVAAEQTEGLLPSTDTKDYYVRANGKTIGPLTADKLKAAAAEGKLKSEMEISTDQQVWKRASSIPGLLPEADPFAELASPPATAPQAAAPTKPLDPIRQTLGLFTNSIQHTVSEFQRGMREAKEEGEAKKAKTEEVKKTNEPQVMATTENHTPSEVVPITPTKEPKSPSPPSGKAGPAGKKTFGCCGLILLAIALVVALYFGFGHTKPENNELGRALGYEVFYHDSMWREVSTNNTNHAKAVELIQSGLYNDKLNTPDPENYVPLRRALENNWLDVVSLLLDKGVPANKPFAADKLQRIHDEYQTPLTVAVRKCPDAVALLMQKGADPNLRDGFGITPWEMAAQDPEKSADQKLKTLKVMVENGAKIDTRWGFNNDFNSKGTTIVHCAARLQEIPVLEYAGTKGMDFNAKSNEGYTPMAYMVKYGDVSPRGWQEVEKVLKQYGAKDNLQDLMKTIRR